MELLGTISDVVIRLAQYIQRKKSLFDLILQEVGQSRYPPCFVKGTTLVLSSSLSPSFCCLVSQS